MASLCKASTLSSAAVSRVSSRSVARPVLALAAPKPACRPVRKAAAQQTRSKTISRVVPVELAQLAGEADFIAGVAGTMWAMTLLGLGLGFVLLRVESLVEEGKL